MKSSSFSLKPLKSRKKIKALFDEGFFCKSYPLICRYSLAEVAAHPHIHVAVAVSHRVHRKAVHRNLIKRRMREAYRRVFVDLLDNKSRQAIDLILVYNSSEILPFDQILRACERITQKIQLPR